jgi:predicted PurR-regulated permease PerM
MNEPTTRDGIVPRIPLRLVATVTLIAVALALVRFAAASLFVVFAGVLFALVLQRTGGWIAARARAPYRVVVGCLALLIAVAIALTLWLLGASLLEQAATLTSELPHVIERFAARLQRAGWFHAVVGVPSRGGASTVEPASVIAGVTRMMGAGGEAMGAFAVVFFIGVYGALDPEGCTRPVVHLAPPSRRPRVEQVLHEIADNLSRWMLGRLVAMAFVGVFTVIGLAVLEVPLAALLGLLAGLATFVEYLGAVVSAVPPLALSASKGSSTALAVAGLFLVTHVIEGYLLTPLLAKSMVRIPPAHALAVQIVMGSIFGVAGLTFATPLLVVATIAVKHFYVEDVLGDRPDDAPKEGGAHPA